MILFGNIVLLIPGPVNSSPPDKMAAISQTIFSDAFRE